MVEEWPSVLFVLTLPGMVAEAVLGMAAMMELTAGMGRREQVWWGWKREQS